MTKARVNADNASADIQGVTAGTGLTGGGTSGTVSLAVDTTTIQTRVANVSDTEIGYLDGVTSAIQTQLNQKPEVVAGKNFVINGNFDIFQRTSFASQTTSAYSLDRWYSAVGGTVTVTQQTTGVPVGSQYCMRTAYNGGGGNYANQHNNLEASVAKILAGRTVTFSVLIRANASYVATSGQGIQVAIDKNSTANTATGGSWSTINSVNTLAASIPTGTSASDWYKVTVTATVPNDGTAAGLRVRVGELVTGPSGAYWEMAQAQLEVGSVATPFSIAGGTIQGELAACQRYYWRATAQTNYSNICFAMGATSTVVQFIMNHPVQMRTNPTSIDYLNLAAYDGSTVYSAYSSIGLNTATLLTVSGNLNFASGITAGKLYQILSNNTTNSYLGISAEL